MQLYHGTRATPPEFIYTGEEGFDMKFSPGGMWGRANYFAVNSSYSNSYRSTLPSGENQMFNAQVIVGNFKELNSDGSIKMPPFI